MSQPATAPSQGVAIRFDSVVFGWPATGQPCIDIAQFEVPRGQSVFIHGPSGSGKSTLLSLVGGVISPQQGRISVLDQDLGALSLRARDRFRADNTGFIFQLFNLIPYLTALDNILLPCRFSHARAQRVEGSLEAEARRLAERLDLDRELLSRSAVALSVGQQQRVAAARALIGRPGLIIADEPTSALDADRQKVFLDLLLAECAHSDATLLFVSHDRGLADRCDRVVSLPEINRIVSGETA